VTDGGVIVPAFRARACGQLRLAVLDVHVPDAIAVAGDRIDGVAAAVCQMPGIEAQPEEIRRRPRHQRLELARRFHVAGGVMVEHRAEAGRVTDCGCDPRGAIGESVPLGIRQAVLGADATGAQRAMRDGGVVVGEDNLGVRPKGRVFGVRPRGRV